MNAGQEREMRRRLVTLIGQMDAVHTMNRDDIEKVQDEIRMACMLGGMNIPEPNSRRK